MSSLKKPKRKHGKRSREKGIEYENLTAAWYREHGFDARRGLQDRDGSEFPDVILEHDVCWWVECKWHKRMGGVHKAYAQAKEAAAPGSWIMVHTHEDGGEHLITMSREDFAAMQGWKTQQAAR